MTLKAQDAYTRLHNSLKRFRDARAITARAIQIQPSLEPEVVARRRLARELQAAELLDAYRQSWKASNLSGFENYAVAAAAGGAIMLALLFNELTQVEEELQAELGIVPDSSKLGRFAKNLGLLVIVGTIGYGGYVGYNRYGKKGKTHAKRK